MDCLIVGAGITGAVIARSLAESGNKVWVWERRSQIGGNMYDYRESHGFLVQKYGPHLFHTTERRLYEYMLRFEQWHEQKLYCRACFQNLCTPSPFNFTTIDQIYTKKHADTVKRKLIEAFPRKEFIPVLELLKHPDEDIHNYADFLFQNDYIPYTAKQWGLLPSDIDSQVMARVPIRLSYKDGYFDDQYQMMPDHSFTTFFDNLLNHPNIRIALNVDALNYLSIEEDQLYVKGKYVPLIVFTGALDELFQCQYGQLPYRALKFRWEYSKCESYQDTAVSVHPQAKGYTRITEYKKLPVQTLPGTVYAFEYPVSYEPEKGAEPYYPVLTEESRALYKKYYQRAKQIKNLIFCGRLGDFKYYNMDQALARALEVADDIMKKQ